MKQKDIPLEAILDIAEKGYSPREAAKVFDISVSSWNNRIAELQKEQPVILQYRKLQNIHLTKLKREILESITPENIEAASLADKVKAWQILNNAEMTELGKPTEIKGLLAHLTVLEKEMSASSATTVNININEIEENWLPE